MFFTIAGIVVMTNLYFFSLYLVYLSIYTWPIYHHFFCFFVIFFFCFSSFFIYTYFWKKNIIFILYIQNIYHSTFDLFIPFFLFFTTSFFCNLIFFLYTFFLNYYIKTKEMMFHGSNFNIVLFFYHVKNQIEILHVSINIYDLHCILLYLSINFLIPNYVFFLMKKKT